MKTTNIDREKLDLTNLELKKSALEKRQNFTVLMTAKF